jgi:hypothetical protein
LAPILEIRLSISKRRFAARLLYIMLSPRSTITTLLS